MAGIDAAVYIRLLTFGALLLDAYMLPGQLSAHALCSAGLQLFLAISLWVLVVVLPTNLVGNEVHHLQNPPPQQQGFAYWLSPPPPATAGTPPAPDAQIKVSLPCIGTWRSCIHAGHLQPLLVLYAAENQQCAMPMQVFNVGAPVLQR